MLRLRPRSLGILIASVVIGASTAGPSAVNGQFIRPESGTVNTMDSSWSSADSRFLSATLPTSNYHWSHIGVDISVRKNGSIRVVETREYVVTDGVLHQGSRRIPTDRLDGIRDIQVAEFGQPYRLVADPEAGGYRVIDTSGPNGNGGHVIDWWFRGTSGATGTVTVSYTVDGVVSLSEEHDEVAWKAVYSERDGEVGSARVAFHPPVPVPLEELRINPSSGSERAEVVDGSTVLYTADRFQAGQELEIRVMFPHGLTSAQAPRWMTNLLIRTEQQRWEEQRQTITGAQQLHLDRALRTSGFLAVIVGCLGLLVLWTKQRWTNLS